MFASIQPLFKSFPPWAVYLFPVLLLAILYFSYRYFAPVAPAPPVRELFQEQEEEDDDDEGPPGLEPVREEQCEGDSCAMPPASADRENFAGTMPGSPVAEFDTSFSSFSAF